MTGLTQVSRGPLTIYGPSSANYDEAVRPTLMTDWNHRSAFQDFYKELTIGPPTMSNILLNGTGMLAVWIAHILERSYSDLDRPIHVYSRRDRKRHDLREITIKVHNHFSEGLLFRKCVVGPHDDSDCEGKKYLLRLINTSVDSTFVFAIDNHDITVMSSDFVPIVPYKTDSVLIGIGKDPVEFYSQCSGLNLAS